MGAGYSGTKKSYVDWMQSYFRQVWSKHPAKLILLQKRRWAMATGKGKRPIYHIQCEHCKQTIKLVDAEVNHKKTVGGLLSLDELERFVVNLLVVDESDLEVLCHSCHGIITYMERSGMTYADAVIEKKVIAFSKHPKEVQMHKLGLAGIETPKPNNATTRKDAVRSYLKRNRK